eukprot:14912228-Alexandrium_andersonii.AAC.1
MWARQCRCSGIFTSRANVLESPTLRAVTTNAQPIVSCTPARLERFDEVVPGTLPLRWLTTPAPLPG